MFCHAEKGTSGQPAFGAHVGKCWGQGNGLFIDVGADWRGAHMSRALGHTHNVCALQVCKFDLNSKGTMWTDPPEPWRRRNPSPGAALALCRTCPLHKDVLSPRDPTGRHPNSQASRTKSPQTNRRLLKPGSDGHGSGQSLGLSSPRRGGARETPPGQRRQGLRGPAGDRAPRPPPWQGAGRRPATFMTRRQPG